jgi:cell division protein FtsA
MILTSLASGTMVTTAEDRQNGVLVIDLGCGTTDFVLYRDGRVHLTGVLPVAGDHLTNDLALGLRLKAADAEKLKLRFGSALVRTRDRHEKVWLNGDYAIGDRQFYRQSIEQITAARTQEIFEVVRKKLGPDWTPEKAAAGVVLTGGTAKLPGIDEAAARVFGVTARVGEAPGWVHENLRDPGFSTPLGLLYYGLNAQPEAAASGRRKAGLFSKLFAFA